MKNPETILERLSITMGELRARYPTKEDWLMSIPPVSSNSHIKPTSVNRFFTSNIRTRGMAFYEAYAAAKESNDEKELCTNVASMLCDVHDGFRSSVEEALHGIGVIPTVVWLPADKDVADGLVWPLILIIFGCCIIMLLKKLTDEVNFKYFMNNSISELKQILGYDADLDIPFDFEKAIEIRRDLGYSSRLRQDAIRFILKKSNSTAQKDRKISGVCHYLCNVLAWSEMRHFKVIKESLVKPKSLILLHPRIARQVEAFTKACESVQSHICPQFFMFLAPVSDVIQARPSRFRTLIAIAQELERKGNNCPIPVKGADWKVVQDLVKLHRDTYGCNSS
ncbi:unnamed protein product [Vicia faba]|uniref:Uncharacterized protein n=1 Tax=Vicia faba TaxID=3906 RepID=A0AAV0YVY3_VICFA|nr:unnamed protein product [Vicia faba]